VALVVLMLTCFGSPCAFGDDPSQPLISEGIELRRVGQDADALPKFERAYKLAPQPRAAAQLGLCYQALGRWSEAERYLSEALKARQDKWISKNLQVLKDSLEALKPNVARIEVHGGPNGATVVINGQRVGEYPLPSAVLVNAGNVDIEVSKTGYASIIRSLQIPGGQYQRILVRLGTTSEPLVVTRSTSPKMLPTAPKAEMATREPPSAFVVTDATPIAEAPAAPVYRRTWFWVAFVSAAAAGAAAIALSAESPSKGPRVDDFGTYGMGQ